jgi:zinc protease
MDSPDTYLSMPSDVLNSLLSEPGADRFILSNGLTVVFKADHSHQLLSLQAWVKTGSIHEGSFTGAGLSHYLEHMLFKGTGKREGRAISREVQEVGGYINAYTSFDRTVYHLDLPSEALSRGMDLLFDMLSDSLIDPVEFEKERKVILREIDMGLDDPDRQVSRMLFQNAFRQHPYRYPVIGLAPLFLRVQRDDLYAYYKGRYTPENTVLIVVGDTTREAVEAELEKTFMDWEPNLLLRPVIPAEPEQLSYRVERQKGDCQICRAAMAYKVPGLTHSDALAIDMLAAVLGNGQSSFLYQEMRERRQLVHHIDATCWNPGDKGLFFISYSCDPSKSGEAEQAILDYLQTIERRPFTIAQLEKVRRQALVHEVNALRTIKGQANRLGIAEVVVGDLDYPRHYLQLLRNVGPSDLNEMIQRHLKATQLTVASIGAAVSKPVQTEVLHSQRDCRDFQQITLNNGVRLLMQPDRKLPKISLRYAGLGGPMYEAANERGITAMMATLMLRDTRYRKASEIFEAIESAGGQLTEYAGNNTFGFSLDVLSQDFPLGLQLLEEALMYPTFETETFETERHAQIAQIREDEDEIAERGRRELRKHFFRDHPYCIDSFGSVEDLEKLSLAAIDAHYRKLVVGRNAVVSVSGDFDPDTMVDELEAVFSALPDFTFHRQPSIPLIHSGERTCRIEVPKEQVVVFEAYGNPGLLDEGAFLYSSLADEILSDMSGQLFERVREESSLAYFVGASRMTGLDTGLFYLNAGTHSKGYEQVLSEFKKELDRIRSGGISQAEFDRCCNRLKIQSRFSLQVAGSRAMQAALDCLYGFPENHWKNHESRVNDLTRAGLAAYAQKYWISENRLQLVIGNL